MSSTPPPKRPQQTKIRRSSVGGQIGQAGRDLWQFQLLFSNTEIEDRKEQQNRRALIDKVQNFWIRGVLEKSLHNLAVIELNLEKRLDAVEQPFNLTLIVSTSEQAKNLPEGSKAIDIFDELGEGATLLILGEPGSGKTITLLSLAQELLQSAEVEGKQIPVIFNLSSWKDKNQSIASWLVQELWEKYQVPISVGRNFIRDENLILLLDGLDEIHVSLRDFCVLALNRFIQEHGKTSTIVCSRINDYQMLSQCLKFQSAISIKPLTLEQVNKYLDGLGESLAAIRTAVQTNSILKELINTPLLLSVMSFAYKDISIMELPITDSKTEHLNHLFDTYIERMLFRRQSTKKAYVDGNSKYWLRFLANQMSKNSQTIFLIEKMQPSWLRGWNEKAIYYVIDGLIIGSSLGTMLGSLLGFVAGLDSDGIISSVYEGLFLGIVSGLILGAIVGTIGGLSFGLIVGLLGISVGKIKTIATLKWSWRTAKENFLFGLLGGLFLSTIGWIETRDINWLFIGLGIGLTMGLIFSLIAGVKSSEIDSTYSPNEGIRKSVLNTGIYILIYSLIFGLAGGITSSLASRDSYFEGGALGALLGGIIGGLSNGQAWSRHLTLRLVLFWSGHIPWNYARFLDYATERIFLQKVGGGYIFIHRLLLEHFSSLPKRS